MSSSNQDFQQLFVIGFPRSGTSLLFKTMCSHPQVSLLEQAHTGSALVDEFVIRGLENVKLYQSGNHTSILAKVYKNLI